MASRYCGARYLSRIVACRTYIFSELEPWLLGSRAGERRALACRSRNSFIGIVPELVDKCECSYVDEH